MINKASTGIDTTIKIGLIAVLTLRCFQSAAPFISSIFWAGIITITIYPILKLLQKTVPSVNNVEISNHPVATG